jgi:Uma2 family endonuclease
VTWDAYRTWPDDERWEIIGGEGFAMTPSPASRHPLVVTNLVGELFPFFRKGPGRLIAAPMDVKLSDEDVVQPDLLVVCDPSQIKETHIDGPPALVIEITSPSSLRHDRVRKFALYARAGVKEYWVVTPYPSLIEVFILTNMGYRLEAGYEDYETFNQLGCAS